MSQEKNQEKNQETESTKSLTPLDEALTQILYNVKPVSLKQPAFIFEADGRVVAQDVRSNINVPGFDNSAMDGYALCSTDISAKDIENSTPFTVSQTIPAGYAGQALQPGTLARIFTGAPVPDGADTVIQQEKTQITADGKVILMQLPKAGDNIRRVGEDIEKGAVVLAKGQLIGPAHIGVAASVGYNALTVFRKLKVALFVTGDELAEPGESLKPGGIYNSNRYVLRSLLERSVCEFSDNGILPDSLSQVKDAFEQAAKHHDLILTSGGVSVGERDYVKEAVSELGKLHLWKLAIKPGKPLAFGQVRRPEEGHCHFLGLPGNPVASFITFLLVVRPFLQKFSGAPVTFPRALTLKANFKAKTKDRQEFLRAQVSERGDVEIYPNQSSGVLTSMTWAEGLVVIPAQSVVEPGDMVQYIPFSEFGI